MTELLREAGYLLIGGVFVWAGAVHFLDFRAVTGQLDERGFPAPVPLLGAGSVLEIAAGLCLMVGVGRTYAAFALIAFTAAASLLALNFWTYSGAERQALRNAFAINIAVMGGLALAATG